jgi:hypothetical protein
MVAVTVLCGKRRREEAMKETVLKETVLKETVLKETVVTHRENGVRLARRE